MKTKEQNRALCPELGLTAYGATARDAGDKLKTMMLDFVMSSCTCDDDFQEQSEGYCSFSPLRTTRCFALVTSGEGTKVFYVPDQRMSH